MANVTQQSDRMCKRSYYNL